MAKVNPPDICFPLFLTRPQQPHLLWAVFWDVSPDGAGQSWFPRDFLMPGGLHWMKESQTPSHHSCSNAGSIGGGQAASLLCHPPLPIGGTSWGSCLRFRAGVWSHPDLSLWCGTTTGEDTLCLLTLCSLAVIIVHLARQQMLSYGFRPQRDVCLLSEKRLIFNLPKVTSHSRWQMWNLRCSHSKALLPACWENQGRR